jgi:hypothetical protein
VACWVLQSICDIVFGSETLLISFIHFQVALSAVFSLWDFMQCRLVVVTCVYVSGPTDWLHLQGAGGQSRTSWPLQMTPSITCTFPICCFRSS